MKIVEMTIEEAIEVLKESKGKVVMVAIQDLEHEKDVVTFSPRLKTDCEVMIKNSESIASICDDFIRQLKVYTEKQLDIANIQPRGYEKTILLKM